MPQINRIRVNNVKYNFGTQFYDDFVMRFSCKNTIYDLANGGGKSVLMLLLLQNLIPNCTLDDKQPVEKLFRTGSGSNTIHSLIEWKLDKENTKNNYKYMLTGFCARKAKEEEGDSGQDNTSIEYFNYCIFYREFNDNDLKNLPLSNGKERITYNGLKNYLRDLEKKDFSLEVKIFDRKGEYKRFIAGFGLYESQWEIIRGINKTEGHVRTYFETNYKTTRKVVEDLLIEEIIEKSFRARVDSDGDDENAMAKNLLDIKDKLIELSKRKDDINSYDMQMEALDSFVGRISGIRQLYFGRADLEDGIEKSYNSLEKIIATREGNLEEYKRKQQELSTERQNINKTLDTAKLEKIKCSMRAMEELIDGITKKLVAARYEYKEKKNHLLMMEGENDYLDYLYYKGERDSIKAMLDSILKDGANLEKDKAVLRLTAMANERKNRNNIKKQELLETLEKETVALEKENKDIEEGEAGEAQYIKELSVAGYLLKDFSDQLSATNSEIYKEKEGLGIVMNVNTKDELAACIKEENTVKEHLEAVKNNIIQWTEDNRNIEYEYGTKESRLIAVEDGISSYISEKDRYSSVRDKISKIEELYGERNIDNLLAVIDERYREIINQVKEAENTIESLQIYTKSLEGGCPVGNTLEVSKIIEYIDRYHGGVAVGGNVFLAQMPLEEREEIIEKIPILPYGIVVKSSYNTIVADAGLKRILKGNYAVPLIREEGIKSFENLFDQSSVRFVMRDENLFTNKDALDKEYTRALEELRDIQDKKVRLDETQSILRLDYDFVKEYRDIHSSRIIHEEREYEDKKLLRKQLKAEIEALENKKMERFTLEQELKEREKSLKNQLIALENKMAVIKKIVSLEVTADDLEKKVNAFKLKKATIEREYRDLTARVKAYRDSVQYRKNAIDGINRQLEAMESQWNSVYKIYFKEMKDISPFGLSDLDDDQLDAKAKGLIEIVSGAMADIKDKHRLLENYDVAMEKALQAIDYKGISLDAIKENHKTGVLKNHTKNELISFKQLLEGVERTIEQMENELSVNRTSRDKMEGAITHGREAIEEKYGSYEEMEIDDLSVERIINENARLIKTVDYSIEENNKKIKEIEESSKDYFIFKRDLDKIIEDANITNLDSTNMWDDGIDFREKILAVSEKYEKYKKEIQTRKEEMEYEKGLLTDTLKALSAFQLADEIRSNVIMPKSVKETEELMDSLREIISCIELEKARVGKGIEDMERIRDNFEKQCIQSCVNIKTELEKLTKLSKIYMDGESVSIIGLTIPYIKEEAYGQHMSQYINQIVEGADSLKSQDERIKYIKNQLSWKKLFSVIVTDMNSIKLTLYKRERIKEQSRYLKYEEAVGSTGQSQGIYIQFLIGIINYITSINSGNIESRNLGKVVFIDNPFGAAKDVYIWEPIFKMLKTNNVQLVVPCRGATPAITGRFDVNYILGQKMMDGKQQTVVVEYYSNVESDNIEYEKLSFEQNLLAFD